MSYYRRTDRDGWRVDVANPGGVPRRLRRTVKTKEEARRVEADLVQQVSKAGPLRFGTSPLADYTSRWLEQLTSQGLQERTVKGYHQVLTRHVLPVLGRMALGKIRPRDVRDFLARLAHQGYAKNTIRNVRIALSAMFSDAVADGVIEMNPILQLGRSQRRTRVDRMTATEREARLHPLTFQQASSVLRVTREMSDAHSGKWEQWSLFIHLLVKTGLRPSETYCLQWGDLDEGTRRIRIQRSQLPDGRLKDPKTHRGRWVDLSRNLLHALQNYRELYRREGEWMFWSIDGTAQPTENHKTAIRAFHAMLGKGGMAQRRLYDLRHTYASLMLSAGVPIPYVSAQLGHASSTTTLAHYSKWVATSEHPAYLEWRLQQGTIKPGLSVDKILSGPTAAPHSILPNDYLDVLDEKIEVFQ